MASGAVRRSIRAIAESGTCGSFCDCDVLVRLDAVLCVVPLPPEEEVSVLGPLPVLDALLESCEEAVPET